MLKHSPSHSWGVLRVRMNWTRIHFPVLFYIPPSPNSIADSTVYLLRNSMKRHQTDRQLVTIHCSDSHKVSSTRCGSNNSTTRNNQTLVSDKIAFLINRVTTHKSFYATQSTSHIHPPPGGILVGVFRFIISE